MSQERWRLYHGDNRDVLPSLPDDYFDAVVTDPPYGLSKEPDVEEVLRHWLAGDDYVHDSKGFMQRSWDSFVPGPATWREIFRTMKPGAHLLCFTGTRTQDLMGIALRMAGFQLRDTVCWLFGTGFPKSLDISKKIGEMAGAEREVVGQRDRYRDGHARQNLGQTGSEFLGLPSGVADITAPATEASKKWNGWGTALKPAVELIILARKPLSEPNVASNVLRHGVGGINIEACRVPAVSRPLRVGRGDKEVGTEGYGSISGGGNAVGETSLGRWPANVVHSGDEEVEAAFAVFGERVMNSRGSAPAGGMTKRKHGTVYGDMKNTVYSSTDADRGSVSRFFSSCPFTGDELRFHYASKASRADRAGSSHPTIKPQALLRWCLRLITPPGGQVLDPFVGSGSTLEAAARLGFRATGVEMEDEYAADVRRRMEAVDNWTVRHATKRLRSVKPNDTETKEVGVWIGMSNAVPETESA